MPVKDYYQTLGVAKDAGEDQIRQAYKRLARKYHPDVNPGDTAAEDRFKEIAEAYAVLGNKEKRAEYDRGPEGFDLGFDPSEIFRRARRGGTGGDPFGFDLSSLFEGAFSGRAAGGQARAARGADLESSLTIEFKDAVRGATLPVTVSRGTGSPESLQVRIPAGIRDGARVRLAGKGAPGPGGPAGDLYVVIRVRPHPVFRREGDDLIRDLPLTFEEAALGAKVDVSTLDGAATMTIPPGTPSGRRFRLKGKGAPSSGRATGDLFVDIQIVPPKDLDDESRRLLREFGRRNPQPGLRS